MLNVAVAVLVLSNSPFTYISLSDVLLNTAVSRYRSVVFNVVVEAALRAVVFCALALAFPFPLCSILYITLAAFDLASETIHLIAEVSFVCTRDEIVNG